LDYSPGAPPINLVCDASLTGGSGVVSQGEDLASAKILAFWSGKFNSAQQNYPVHEQDILGIIESLKQFQHMLMGTKFRVFTDHKGLEHIMTQKNLSLRQVRWLETLSDFDFDIKYIPGETNTLADALSRIYSAEEPGTIRAPSEYIDADDPMISAAWMALDSVSWPVFIGSIAEPLDKTESVSDRPKVKKLTLRLRDPISGKLLPTPKSPDGTRAMEEPSQVENTKELAQEGEPTSQIGSEKPNNVNRGGSTCFRDSLGFVGCIRKP
jgi:hypothetical protein